ncbi:melanocortin receptor 3-like [Oculina patagonica]
MATESDTQDVPVVVSFISTIVINSISCPFTVLLNVLVIMAVKRRPRLQNNANILLACLAATDAFTGLTVQPSFILWKILQLLEVVGQETEDALRESHNSSLRAAFMCSSLHLMLVTCERLVAIKFTVHYPYVVTKKNMKFAVIAIWIFTITCEITGILTTVNGEKQIFNFILAFILISCVSFITCSYVIFFRETRRHQKQIKTQQLPQEEVERFAKESKVLKTTVFVVGAVLLCFLPSAIFLSTRVLGAQPKGWRPRVYTPWIRTFGMLNSLLNPLIYCWRQKEMRQFVFRFQTQAVYPLN